MSESGVGSITRTIDENTMRRIAREEVARELEETAQRIRYPEHKFERVHASVPEAIRGDRSGFGPRVRGDIATESLIEDLVNVHTGESIDRFQELHVSKDGHIVVIREKVDGQGAEETDDE